MSKAFVTLLTSEAYLPGALTLAATLKHHQTKHPVVVLLASEAFSKHSLELIDSVYDEIIPLEKLLVAPLEKLVEQLGRKELAVTFTKLLLWNQTQYDQLVYLDSDTLPLGNLDSLFETYADVASTQIVASPDSGWPDIFNSGVLVLKPSTVVFDKLIAHAGDEKNTFDGADQGLLNEFFNVASEGANWVRLPFKYNVTPNLGQHYQYLPAFTRFFKDIQLLHFFGTHKPWHSASILDSDTTNFHHLWWAEFAKHFPDSEVRSKLLSSQGGEAYKLNFSKYTNAWDDTEAETEAKSESDAQTFQETDWDAETENPPIFPWEHRQQHAPSRVFQSASAPAGQPQGGLSSTDSDLSKNIETLSKVKIGSSKGSGNSLSKSYVFSEEGSFNPDQSFEAVSKLPLQFLTKQNEKKQKPKE